MNIFAISDDPKIAAQGHIDKHVVKMVCETAELLSTAHRVLDGALSTFTLPTNKEQKMLLLPGERVALRSPVEGGFMLLEGELQRAIKKTQKYEIVNRKVYSATHVNHPCGIWTRESDSNYNWLFALFRELSKEYSHRYGKTHKTWSDLSDFLSQAPRNIAAGDRTEFAVAMPDEYRVLNDPISSYKNYYLGSKARFARWTNRKPPSWFIAGTKDYDASNFERTT